MSRDRDGGYPSQSEPPTQLPPIDNTGIGPTFNVGVTPTDERQWALFCAVLHYGLANLASKAMPAKSETVVEAAKRFENYLNNGE